MQRGNVYLDKWSHTILFLLCLSLPQLKLRHPEACFASHHRQYCRDHCLLLQGQNCRFQVQCLLGPCLQVPLQTVCWFITLAVPCLGVSNAEQVSNSK